MDGQPILDWDARSQSFHWTRSCFTWGVNPEFCEPQKIRQGSRLPPRFFCHLQKMCTRLCLGLFSVDGGSAGPTLRFGKICSCKFLVPRKGLEPSCFWRSPLKRVCLPIPPPGHRLIIITALGKSASVAPLHTVPTGKTYCSSKRIANWSGGGRCFG